MSEPRLVPTRRVNVWDSAGIEDLAERVHGKVVRRVRQIVIHGLVEVGGQESAVILVSERGGDGINDQDTASRDGAGLI